MSNRFTGRGLIRAGVQRVEGRDALQVGHITTGQPGPVRTRMGNGAHRMQG